MHHLLISAAMLSFSCAEPLSPADQQEIAAEVAAKAQRSETWKDDEGHITGFILINHQSLEKTTGPKPGVSDDDLLKLADFPKLTALHLEAQPLSDRGLGVLENFPAMKQVGFHYMAKHPEADVSAGFIQLIDGMRDLEILEIKHNFRVKDIAVEGLKGPFPKVWRLVLDTPQSAAQTMHLLRLTPGVTDLQLHRTRLSPEQLAEVAELLPDLEVLWFKPQGDLLPSHLEALKKFPKLRIFSPQHFKNALPYEGAWEHLAEMPALGRLEIGGERTNQEAALGELQNARPELVIDSKLTRSRNYDGL